MKAPLRISIFAALALGGCVGKPIPPDSSVLHPGNPHAAASPVPPMQAGLLSLTNLAMVKPGNNAAAEHQHDHGQHEPNRKAEEKK